MDVRGFIRGRCILDNLMLVREAKAHLNRNNSPAVLIAFDFSKAYDRVSWPFLWKCMSAYGFGNKFIRWLTILTEKASAHVIVNGDLTERFTIGRSVRQGCPLAPSLFVLLTDFLSWRFCIDRKIKGVVDPCGKEHRISLLADDTFVFSDASEGSLQAIIKEMNTFTFLSGLQLNWDKSVLLGLNLREPLPGCVQHFQILRLGDKTKYLGAPLMLLDENEAIGQDILRRVMEKASKLQIMKLSMAGRVLALNAILQGMLWYFMFISAPSDADVKKLKKLILKFLWDRPIAGQAPRSRVMGAHMCQSKDDGGFGLVDPFLKKEPQRDTCRLTMLSTTSQATTTLHYSCGVSSHGCHQAATPAASSNHSMPHPRFILHIPRIVNVCSEKHKGVWLDTLKPSCLARCPKTRYRYYRPCL